MRKICLESHILEDGFGDDDIKERLQDMDEAGIDMQVLSFIFPMHFYPDPSRAKSMARNANNALAKVVDKYPRRFAGFAAVALHDPEAAAGELERAVKELGFPATMIFLPVNEGLDNGKYRVVFERAARLGVPIYMHPGQPSPEMIKPFLTYPILKDAVWGFAAEGGLQAMRLIFSGLFDEFPELKIILGHMGEGIPYWLWRIDDRWKNSKDLEMYKSIAEPIELKKTPGQYFLDNFYITTSGMFWTPVLQFANSVLGADRILFSVDYGPGGKLEALKASQFIESAPISDNEREKICHLNAEKLLKLKLE